VVRYNFFFQMKKISFLVVAIIFGHLTRAQEPISDVVTLTLPAKAKILTKDQFLTYEHYAFKYSRSKAFENDNRFYTNLYSIYGILTRFFDLNVSPDDNRTLEQLQQEMAKRIMNRNVNMVINYSKIITINDIPFLICEYQTADEVFLRFMSYKNNNKLITGVFEFKKPNEELAQKLLDNMLNSMHFKN